MRNILFFAEDRGYPDARVWDEIRNFQEVPEHA
jgi:hypothetical protein